MHVSTVNDVKIYNLSAGKSVPEWIGSEARRRLERKDLDVRRRIQLIQDFNMPDISHTIDVSPDGRYIVATGAYKPWLKCYDLSDLSLKFERGVDSDIIKVVILSDDYSKLVVLEQDRYLEMHAAFGRYFRMRMPRFGRDMSYSRECSDLYLVGASNGVEVTALKFRDALHLGVGMSSGHVLVYDIRSSKPLIVKDHNNGLPIKKLDFVKRDEGNLVLSMDERVLKMWDENCGKPFAAIETETALTDFTRYPDSGLIFFANEAPRMLQYFVPSLGTAPKWCSYLETITEELEENAQPTVYDDYKFVTKTELDDMGLSHLIGSTLLRAYMHGYFIDIRLYNKAQTLTQPFAYDKYKERKVKDLVLEERENTIIKKKDILPKVNKDLAIRLRLEAETDIASVKSVKKKKSDKKKVGLFSFILIDSISLRDKKQALDRGGDLDHVEDTPFGGRSMTFTLQKSGAAGFAEREKKHKRRLYNSYVDDQLLISERVKSMNASVYDYWGSLTIILDVTCLGGI
uniref:Nucleolar protein 10 n=1 Tax=Heterorhabditis bacteriophora TaxID=37862 RepID=A0A1I7WMZ7_HETBA